MKSYLCTVRRQGDAGKVPAVEWSIKTWAGPLAEAVFLPKTIGNIIYWILIFNNRSLKWLWRYQVIKTYWGSKERLTLWNGRSWERWKDVLGVADRSLANLLSNWCWGSVQQPYSRSLLSSVFRYSICANLFHREQCSLLLMVFTPWKRYAHTLPAVRPWGEGQVLRLLGAAAEWIKLRRNCPSTGTASGTYCGIVLRGYW